MALQRVHLSSYLLNPTKAPGVGAFNRFKPYYQYLPRSPQVVNSNELEISPTAPTDLAGYTESDHKNFESLVKSRENEVDPAAGKASQKVEDITDIDFDELSSLKPKETRTKSPERAKSPPKSRSKSPAKERSKSPEGAPPAKRKRSIKTNFDLKD